MLSRSRFVLLLIAVVALPVAGQESAPPPVEIGSLGGPLHLLQCNGNVHVVASVGPDGVLLVDTGYEATADAVGLALEDLGAGSVRLIVNTHGDADHVGGNEALGAAALFVAHPAARRQVGSYFALPPTAAAGEPAIAAEDEITIHFNGEVVRVVPVPGGHTAGDLIVHFTGSGVVCLGDIVLGGTFPNADPARGGDAQVLIDVLDRLIADLPDDVTLVPGHGQPLTIGELREYRSMVEGTVAAVAREVAEGRSLDATLESQPIAPWAEWESPERRRSFADWTAEIYASLTGEAIPSICQPMTEALVADGIDAAVRRYRVLRAEQPEGWQFAEGELNTLGYQLLQRNMVPEAIAVFQLNVEAYPDAFNTYDSLGEAYMIAGDPELAVANYQRSLELNPDNANATAMLARLQGEEAAQ